MNKLSEHGGVQGVLTLNYKCYEDSARKEEIAYATQLSAADDNTVVLLEYNQEKGIMNNVEVGKYSSKYRISAERLVSLIKENGDKVK